MKSLEAQIFNVSFVYNTNLAQKLVIIILGAKKGVEKFNYDIDALKKQGNKSAEIANIISKIKRLEKRQHSVKSLLFKMMKDVVKKNIQNYQNLLRGIEDIPREDIPASDELVADCWEVFHICTEKYNPEIGDNFYFFFNKALSRKFYRKYQDKQREMFREPRLDEECDYENRMYMSSLGDVETVELMIDVLDFTDIEKRIIRSKLKEHRTQDFLKENKDISSVAYSRAMASIKEKLLQAYNL